MSTGSDISSLVSLRPCQHYVRHGQIRLTDYTIARLTQRRSAISRTSILPTHKIVDDTCALPQGIYYPLTRALIPFFCISPSHVSCCRHFPIRISIHQYRTMRGKSEYTHTAQTSISDTWAKEGILHSSFTIIAFQELLIRHIVSPSRHQQSNLNSAVFQPSVGLQIICEINANPYLRGPRQDLEQSCSLLLQHSTAQSSTSIKMSIERHTRMITRKSLVFSVGYVVLRMSRNTEVL